MVKKKLTLLAVGDNLLYMKIRIKCTHCAPLCEVGRYCGGTTGNTLYGQAAVSPLWDGYGHKAPERFTNSSAWGHYVLQDLM